MPFKLRRRLADILVWTLVLFKQGEYSFHTANMASDRQKCAQYSHIITTWWLVVVAMCAHRNDYYSFIEIISLFCGFCFNTLTVAV